MSRPNGDSPPRMRGANGSTAGARGLVPKPAAADNVKYLKGDGTWSALSNASAATNAEAAAATSTTTFVTPANAAMAVAAQRNGLAPAQGLVFDGTAGATVTLPVYGTNPFTHAVRASTPGSVANIILAPFEPTVAPLLYINSSNKIIYSNVDAVLMTSVVTLSANVIYDIAVVRESTASSKAYLYVNGVLDSTFTDATNYATAIKDIGFYNAANFYTGTIRIVGLLNRALSAAEVLALYQSGAPAGADYALLRSGFAAGTAITLGTFSALSTGLTVTGASATGFTASGTANDAYAGGVFSSYSVTSKVGQRYRATWTYTPTSGATPTVGLAWEGNGVFSNTVSASAGTGDFTVTLAGYAGKLAFLTANGATTSYAVSNVTLTPLGLLLAPDSNNAGAGLEWLDVSGNRAHIVLPTSGVSWSLPSSQQIVIEATTSTATNQQLGGAALIDVNKQWRIQSWTVNCSTGTPTISLGNASAGAQYVSALVLAAGNNDITLLARFPATANLWASSTTTATLIHRIVLAPAN